MAAAIGLRGAARHMWTASLASCFFALNEWVGFGHMSGLLMRTLLRWP